LVIALRLKRGRLFALACPQNKFLVLGDRTSCGDYCEMIMAEELVITTLDLGMNGSMKLKL
jgi:hypothetical protein